MNSAVDKSPKLIFNEFQKSITEVPLDVFYQNITCDQFNASGFQFNIKQPGSRALLDPDIWIRYQIPIEETQQWKLQEMFENADTDGQPANNYRLALRSGYTMWRLMQNFSLQINNTTVTVQPYRWVDVLNRLYVSNLQASHEFSTSGGVFDSGNHSLRTDSKTFTIRNPIGGHTYAIIGNNLGLTAYDVDPTKMVFSQNYNSPPLRENNQGNYLVGGIQANYPNHYEVWNQGFSDRFHQMADRFRFYRTNFANSGLPDNAGTNVPDNVNHEDQGGGIQFRGDNVGSPQDEAHRLNLYWIEIYERLPLPLFKMYNNDAVYGVIPNVTQMQIQANFMARFTENFVRGVEATTGVAVPCTVNFERTTGKELTLYLRWFTPPQTMIIPRELSIPYPKIVAWSKAVDIAGFNNNPQLFYTTGTVEEYNVTLESIPDLLLIYIKFRNFDYSQQSPDDYLLEIKELYINIDSSSGKLNQIQTIDLYNKWKKILKHSDSHIIGYDEWRKYCCVACLQPDDYGVRFGPGYSNQTVLGMKITYRNWWNIPSWHYAPPEPYNAGSFDLYVTAIYNRNRLVIRADGTAQQDMLKVAADFNMTPAPAVAAMDTRGVLNL